MTRICPVLPPPPISNHQYANMYFSRLFELSGVVKKRAYEKWNGAKGTSDEGNSLQVLASD